MAWDIFSFSVLDCHRRRGFAAFPSSSATTSALRRIGGDRGDMTASNDNRRVRKKRGRARGPESVAKMARVLADIYARPPATIIDCQDDLFARLEDERLPAALGHEPGAWPAAEKAGS